MNSEEDLKILTNYYYQQAGGNHGIFDGAVYQKGYGMLK